MAKFPPVESYSSVRLHELCDQLLLDNPEAVEESVAFLEGESFGYWHGRARAKMGRRLKHRSLTLDQRDRLANAILGRLVAGRISEGFRDQLRLILRWDAERAFMAARECPGSAPGYVHRFCDWVLAHLAIQDFYANFATKYAAISVNELNGIAAEFGLVFERRPHVARTVWANRAFDDVRGALADRCEELGSRWCECIRWGVKSRTIVKTGHFPLIS